MYFRSTATSTAKGDKYFHVVGYKYVHVDMKWLEKEGTCSYNIPRS